MMSKMNELGRALNDLRFCGEKLIVIADMLQGVFSSPEQQETAPEAMSQKPEKKYSFIEVRGILADKSRIGHTVAVKDLLRKYGVDKLSDLAEEYYAAIIADAEAL